MALRFVPSTILLVLAVATALVGVCDGRGHNRKLPLPTGMPPGRASLPSSNSIVHGKQAAVSNGTKGAWMPFDQQNEIQVDKGPAANDINVNMDTDLGVPFIVNNWDYVRSGVIFMFALLIFLITAVTWHNIPGVSTFFPESCLLMLVGICVGDILSAVNLLGEGFPSQYFFLIILPPVVIDASFDLNHRLFVENIGAVLLFAIVGTLINFAVIGPLLYGLSEWGWFGKDQLNSVECMYFASFIVAVDPVAVLAIFSEVGVNEVLFFAVFGEALLNDAVTVALFNGMDALRDWSYVPWNQWLRFLVFLCIGSGGGWIIGVTMAFCSAIMVRLCHNHYVLEIMSVMTFVTLANLIPWGFDWSGIYGMWGCAMTQAQFVIPSMERDTQITLRRWFHTMGCVAECIVFLLLGSEVFRINFELNWGFNWSCLLACLIGRVFSVAILVNCLNCYRVRKFPWNEQVIMWWGGLRGAVAYGLVSDIDNSYASKALYTCATLFIIFFTVFIMGLLTRPLLGLLSIDLAVPGVSLWRKVYLPVNDRMMEAIEIIAGGDQITSEHRLKMWAYRARDRYWRKAFTRHNIHHDMDAIKMINAIPKQIALGEPIYEKDIGVIKAIEAQKKSVAYDNVAFETEVKSNGNSQADSSTSL